MALSAKEKKVRFGTVILLIILAGTAVVLISSVAAATGVTISAQGDQSYYLGEEILLTGSNDDSNFTYLFITGPGISPAGGKLTTPLQDVVSGDPGSFERIRTQPDKTWEYTLYTSDLGIDPGPYLLYAVSQPKTATQLTGAENKSVRLIFKKPFITANVTPSVNITGQPFTVTGYAEGNPEAVQVWIFGDNYVFNTTVPTSPDQSYRFTSTSQILENLPKGPCWLIVQHPMKDNRLDIVRDGDWVKSLTPGSAGSGGSTLFRITGPGSLQGRDAAGALIAALNDPGVDDTYTEIPLNVEDDAGTGSGSASDVAFSGPANPQTQADPALPVPSQTRASTLLVTPIGAMLAICGIFVWSRR